MKKIVVLFLVMSAFTFVSCGDDDDKVKISDKDKLIGKWTLYATEFKGKFKIHEQPACGKKEYIEFKSDFTGVDFYYNSEEDCEEIIDNITYSIEGNKLTTFNKNDTITSIYSFEKDKLILTSKESKGIFKRL